MVGYLVYVIDVLGKARERVVLMDLCKLRNCPVWHEDMEVKVYQGLGLNAQGHLSIGS